MFSKCFEDIMIPKYHKYSVYTNNLGKFDIHFIFKLVIDKYDYSNLVTRGRTLIYFTLKKKKEVK